MRSEAASRAARDVAARVAVVTGASAGIGASTVEHLAQAGYRVFAGARRLAERIRWELERREFNREGNRLKMTASFGVAALEAGENGEALFNKADAALYRAKASGRNRVEK